MQYVTSFYIIHTTGIQYTFELIFTAMVFWQPGSSLTWLSAYDDSQFIVINARSALSHKKFTIHVRLTPHIVFYYTHTLVFDSMFPL